jgi:hypothetical protein
VDPVDGAGGIEPIAGGGPGWRRQEAGAFVVADRVGSDADQLGEFGDLVAGCGGRGGSHGATVDL